MENGSLYEGFFLNGKPYGRVRMIIGSYNSIECTILENGITGYVMEKI